MRTVNLGDILQLRSNTTKGSSQMIWSTLDMIGISRCNLLLSLNCGCFFALSFGGRFFVVFALPYLIDNSSIIAFSTEDTKCPFERHTTRVNAWHLLSCQKCTLSCVVYVLCCVLIAHFYQVESQVSLRSHCCTLYAGI